MRNCIKGFVVLGAVAAGVVAANATTVVLESAGTWTASGGGDWTQAESVIQSVSSTGGLPELDNLAVATSGAASATPTAVAIYSNTAGTQTLSLDWTITNQEYSGATGDIFSMDGTWTYAGGTGGYAGLEGTGTFAVTQTNASNASTGFSGTVLAGDLQAVPEPATYAVLGLGALGLFRRRKAAW